MFSSFSFIGFLVKRWREFLIVILAGLCYYQYSQPDTVAAPITKVEYITKVKREKETIRVTEPGGRIVEKIIEVAVETNEKTDTQVSPPKADKWTVGVNYNVSTKGYGADLYRRLGTSPFSAGIGYDSGTKSISLGARVHW